MRAGAEREREHGADQREEHVPLGVPNVALAAEKRRAVGTVL